MKRGFDVEAPRNSDPGDFGWGIYLTDCLERARAYGDAVFEVDIDLSRFAAIPNPYFLKSVESGFVNTKPRTYDEVLFYNIAFNENGRMRTVVGDDRVDVAKEIRDSFLDHGYAGIVGNSGKNREIVVFDSSAITRVNMI